MPSDLYNSIGGRSVPAQQNPKDAAMELLKQRGISVPNEIAGNPGAIIQHLMQSGAIPQNRLAMAQQMLSKLFHR